MDDFTLERPVSYTPKGITTAIVTPLTAKDELDESALRKLIDFQIESGISGLLVTGGSGEYVSLDPSERQQVVEIAVDHVAGRIPVVVGALSPGFREVQAAVVHAEKSGADAVLVLPPYYIKPSAKGVLEHFQRIADSVSLPIVAYNNSGRTGIQLDLAMLEQLAKIPSITALKECERDLGIIASKIKAVGDRIAVLSGDDDLALPTFLLGSPGAMFTTPNLAPAAHCKLFDACQRGDLLTAKSLHYALLDLIEPLYTPNHPGPLKEAMKLIGHDVGRARSPLQGADSKNLALAEAALKKLAALL